MIVTYIVIEILIGIVIGSVLGRFAKFAGFVILALGVVPMGALYIYETYFHTSGDTSSVGMLATLTAILFFPLGLVVLITSFLTNRE